jgi:thiamine-monophosphate kinase
MRATTDTGAQPSSAAFPEPLDCGDGRQLVVVIDTLVEGVHFAADAAPADVGFKALAVNLSDLAAMGAEPRSARASVCHPGDDAGPWRDAFGEGLLAIATRFGVDVTATVTARGPLCVTVEALGSIPEGLALTRAGAAPGDSIAVTGTLGDAGLALAGGAPTAAPDDDPWLQARLTRPEPRVAAGIALRGLASAAIDVSDGLAADLGHILVASGVGARLDVESLPLSRALADALSPGRAWELALASGDDYELCFTVAPGQLAEAQRRLDALPCGATVIGTVTAAVGLQCLRGDGSRFDPTSGYRHFP